MTSIMSSTAQTQADAVTADGGAGGSFAAPSSVELTRELTLDERRRLRDWVEWVDRGAPEHGPFLRVIGLCGALDNYSIFKNDYPFGKDVGLHVLRGKYPYTNPARVAWARANAAGAGE